jgi:hypothetical protein
LKEKNGSYYEECSSSSPAYTTLSIDPVVRG